MWLTSNRKTLKSEIKLTKLDLKSASDEELMVLYQTSLSSIECSDVFNMLFNRWKDRLWSYVSKKVRSAEEREDVIQKIFLKLHNSKSQYQPRFHFSQWIFTIAKTTLIDHLRSQHKFKSNEVEFTDEIIATEDNVDNMTIESDKVDMSSLTLEQQQIINMRFEEDLDFKEIAILLNKNETSVRKILSRAYGKIRNLNLLRGIS